MGNNLSLHMATSALERALPPAQDGIEIPPETKEQDRQSVAYLLMRGLLNGVDESEAELRHVEHDPEVLSARENSSDELDPDEAHTDEALNVDDTRANELQNVAKSSVDGLIAKLEAAGYKLTTLVEVEPKPHSGSGASL
eukprot:Amastigsp_a174710_380.p1 type:complete len:140 gc:universal Amastigsp_a174710_380:449-30(-)